MNKAQLERLIKLMPPDAFDIWLGKQGGGNDTISFQTLEPEKVDAKLWRPTLSHKVGTRFVTGAKQ